MLLDGAVNVNKFPTQGFEKSSTQVQAMSAVYEAAKCVCSGSVRVVRMPKDSGFCEIGA